MEISDIKDFKDNQHKIIQLFMLTSLWIIIFDGQVSGLHSREHSLTRSTFSLSILANVMYFILLTVAMFAERIYRRRVNPDNYCNFKRNCQVISILSPLFIPWSSLTLHSGFGDQILIIHALTYLIVGIIIPLIWICLDKRNLKVKMTDAFY